VFAGLINQAKSALSRVVMEYVARASVAVPFVIALGFALAAIAVMLVERFGHIAGYWIMAGGLAAIGVIAAIAVSAKEHKEEVADQQAEETDNRSVISGATAQAMAQAPLALLGALFSAPGGATSVLKIAQILGRNFPMVLLLAMIGALFWPTAAKAPDDAIDQSNAKPNGFHPVETYH